MTTHTLKTDSAVFTAVASGEKTFEIRKDDRGFKVGDNLRLIHTVHTGNEIATRLPLIRGESLLVKVTYILRGPCYGLAEGLVIMSIVPVFSNEGNQ